MAHVRQQPVSLQPGLEQPLAEADRAGGIELVESRCPPVLFRGLHDERGGVVVETVGVGLEPAICRFDENEGERLEHPVCTEPDEPVLPDVDRRLEMRRVATADLAVDAVRRHDQVGVGECGDIVQLPLK